MKRRQRRELGRSKPLVPADIEAANDMLTPNRLYGPIDHESKTSRTSSTDRGRSKNATANSGHKRSAKSQSVERPKSDAETTMTTSVTTKSKLPKSIKEQSVVSKDADYLKKNKRLSEVSRKVDAWKERTKSELAKIENIAAKCKKGIQASISSAAATSTQPTEPILSKPLSKSDVCSSTAVASTSKSQYDIEDIPYRTGMNPSTFGAIKKDTSPSKIPIADADQSCKLTKHERIRFKDDTSLYMRHPRVHSSEFYKERKRSSSTEENFRFNEYGLRRNVESMLPAAKKDQSTDALNIAADSSNRKKSLDSLRRKSSEENSATNHIVSILKKKDYNDSSSASSNASPVTFSSSVVDTPTRSTSKQGILKKRSSLDESRYSRSHSPDERSILVRTPRRSSLEELQPGILKQKSYDSKSGSITNIEPHGILKKKETSTPSENYPKHVSISEAVILAAAELCKTALICDGSSPSSIDHDIKPILKQDTPTVSTPRPILKKKQSSETEEIRPILKTSRKSSREESDPDDCVRPILKMDSPAKRMSFCDYYKSTVSVLERSHSMENQEPDFVPPVAPVPVATIEKPLVSVAERIRNMEQVLSANVTATTKPITKREANRGRFKTQPITVDEISW